MTTIFKRTGANQPLPALVLKYAMACPWTDWTDTDFDEYGDFFDPNDGQCPWHPAINVASKIKTMWQDSTPRGCGRTDSFQVKFDLFNATGDSLDPDNYADRRYVGQVVFLYNPANANALPLDYLAECVYDFLAEYESARDWEPKVRILHAEDDHYGVDDLGHPVSAEWADR